MKTDSKPYAHLSLVSNNAKTGKIPVSTTSRDSCPTGCELRGKGCYAEGGPVALHWNAVTSGDRGMPWGMFCEAVATLPPMQLWRHNQAGDLPGDGVEIDFEKLELLLAANFGKRGFTYTHYRPWDGSNAHAIATANVRGLTVNLSANNLEEADELFDAGCGPVVVVLPHDQVENTKTPGGRAVVVCPAAIRDDTDCKSCGMCYLQRDSIIGFPAHGQSFKKVTFIARGQEAEI